MERLQMVDNSKIDVLTERMANMIEALDKVDKKVDSLSEVVLELKEVRTELSFNRIEFQKNRQDIGAIKEKSDKNEIEIKGINTTIKIAGSLVGFIAAASLSVSVFMLGQYLGGKESENKSRSDIDKRISVLEYQVNPKNSPKPIIMKEGE